MSHNKKEIFARSEAIVKKILEGGVEKFVKNKSELFDLKERTLKCIDERTPGGVHLAGSGILLGVEKAIAFIRTAKIDKVTWHNQCGAVALYLKNQGQSPTGEKIDETARKFSETLAERAGAVVEEEIMQGETSFHGARAIYFDNTGEFNVAEELPAGFVISRAYLEKDYAQEELKIALSIAFGDHGFGELFTRAQPLLIVGISDRETIGEIITELKQAVSGLPEYKEGKIKIDQLIR